MYKMNLESKDIGMSGYYVHKVNKNLSFIYVVCAYIYIYIYIYIIVNFFKQLKRDNVMLRCRDFCCLFLFFRSFLFIYRGTWHLHAESLAVTPREAKITRAT